jgi:hypothetical protein
MSNDTGFGSGYQPGPSSGFGDPSDNAPHPAGEAGKVATGSGPAVSAFGSDGTAKVAVKVKESASQPKAEGSEPSGGSGAE